MCHVLEFIAMSTMLKLLIARKREEPENNEQISDRPSRKMLAEKAAGTHATIRDRGVPLIWQSHVQALRRDQLQSAQ